MLIRVVVGQYGVQLKLKRIFKTSIWLTEINNYILFHMYQIVDLSTLYSPNPNKGGTAIVKTMPQTFQTCLEDQKLLRDGVCHDLSKRTTDKYLIPAMLTIVKYELSPLKNVRLITFQSNWIKFWIQNMIFFCLIEIQ